MTVISVGSFTPRSVRPTIHRTPSATRILGSTSLQSFPGALFATGRAGDAFATADIPSGAIIDFIGLETFTNVFAAWGVDLLLVDRHNAQTVIGSVNSTVHGWDSDYNAAPLGYQLTRNVHNSLVVHIQQAGSDQPACAYFGWVEIWWRRQVSPAPANPSFTDVPTSDFGYQYIEALKASGITGGCGGTQFCPDAPLTRRQMAIFLAKALGLDWPY